MAKKALFHDIHYTESARMAWRVNIPDDHDIEDISDPSYLWDRAREIKSGDRIEYWATDGRFFIEHIVMGIDTKTRSVLVREITRLEWGDQKPVHADISHAEIKWGGPQHKYRVLIGSEILSMGHSTKEKAQNWINEQVLRANSDEPVNEAA